MSSLQIRKPLIDRKEHSQKGSFKTTREIPLTGILVRDLKCNNDLETFTTVSADHTVKIWDCHNLDVISSIDIIDSDELVCLSIDISDSHLIAVGK